MNNGVQHLRTIRLDPLTPSNLAYLEIQRLSGDEETMCIVVLGGTLTEDQVAENSRREQLRKQKVIDIIKKHGVEAEYIAPRVANIRRLKAELKEEQSWLAALKS